VVGTRERGAPTRSLGLELVREERVAQLVGPVGDLGPRRCVELAQERLVAIDGRAPLRPWRY
jgi:hypothetical protein